MKKLQAFMIKNVKWGNATFDQNRHRTERSIPTLEHLKEEVSELQEAIDRWHKFPSAANREKVMMEAADNLILLTQALSLMHITAEELMEAAEKKHDINQKRKWGSPDDKGIIKHTNYE